MTTNKPAAKKPAARKPAAKKSATPRSAAKTAKTIRNLRNHPVHLRLMGEGERPYFIQLHARGLNGDAHRVPANLTEADTFVQGAGFLFEIITQTELKSIEYPPTGYLHNPQVQIIRPEHQTVVKTPDWDGKGRPPQHDVQPRPMPDIRTVAGGEFAARPLQGDKRATASEMLPEGLDLESRTVRVERVRQS